MLRFASKQDPHGKIHLIRNAAVAIDWKTLQPSEFGRKHQVRARTKHHVRHRNAITSKDRNEIVRIRSEASYVSSKRIVLSGHAVYFQLRR
jgi:hypothetical protein